MPEELYGLFHLFIVTQAIFFFLLILFTPHGRPLAKYCLLAFVLAQTATPVQNYLSSSLDLTATYKTYIHSLFYLSGPAFYFYIKTLRSPTFRFGLQQLWHLLPVVSIWVISQTVLGGNPENPADSKALEHTGYLLILVVWLLCYMTAGLRLIPGPKSFFQGLFSLGDNTIWRWLYIPTLFYIVVYLLAMGFFIAQITLYPPLIDVEPAIIVVMSARIVFFYLVAIGGYRHRYVYEKQEEVLPGENPIGETCKPDGKSKYQTSTLDEEQVNTIWRTLTDYMSTHEPFLNSSLKLTQLANDLNVSAHNLSQVINTCAGKSFHDFINGYRTRKAQALIEEYADSDKQILDLSLAAGFGNSGTFYKYFKKHVSMTPAQYRRFCLAH